VALLYKQRVLRSDFSIRVVFTGEDFYSGPSVKMEAGSVCKTEFELNTALNAQHRELGNRLTAYYFDECAHVGPRNHGSLLGVERFVSTKRSAVGIATATTECKRHDLTSEPLNFLGRAFC
jgi:hypothetical protein